MDFGGVLSTIAGELERDGRRFAVIGGVALAALGMPRTTLDLDIVTDATNQQALVSFLERLGFQTVHRSVGYSNHLHRQGAFGRVDVVYVQGETADQLFGAAQRIPGPSGVDMPVPAAEHLAAMKVLAIKNDPARVFQDLADIRFLLARPGVDRERVREYFRRHGLLHRYEDVERTL